VTVITYRDGVLAADSRVTVDSEGGGTRMFLCDKLFRKIVTVDGEQQEVILATAGESSSGMHFVDWYGSGKEPPIELFTYADADFTILVLKKDGLWEYDAWCRGMRVKDRFYAVGSGAKAALGAMHMGASAEQAAKIACKIDPYCALPVLAMSLGERPKKTASKPRKTLSKPDPVVIHTEKTVE
jgi:ATP-dependent protease HslVU (ClpYQ) peptidase subunit